MLLTPTNCCHGDGGDGSPFSSYIICANVSAMRLTPDNCCHGDGSPFSSCIADIPCMDWRIEVTWKESDVSLVRHSKYLAWNLVSYVRVVSSRANRVLK